MSADTSPPLVAPTERTPEIASRCLVTPRVDDASPETYSCSFGILRHGAELAQATCRVLELS